MHLATFIYAFLLNAPVVIVTSPSSPSVLSWLAPLLAVVGVLLGLAGKWWADVHMQKREMKRSCYMNLAKAVHECIRSISALLDPNRPVIDVSAEYTRLSSPFASAQVVADMPLSLAINGLTGFMMQLHARLVTMRSKLDPLHSQYHFLDSLITKAQVAIDSNLEEQKRFNIEENGSAQRWEALRYQFDFQQRQQESLRSDQQKVGQQAQAKLQAMAETLAGQMQAFPPLITEALRCVRKELGFPFDERAFLASMQAAGAVAQTTIRSALTEMSETDEASKSDEPPSVSEP